ncbi:MAG: helix-turn-helix domain-containing protein [Beijerinckiaceae bacterium]
MREQKIFVGAGIRRLRNSRSMTQAELAQRLRISTAYLSQMETNQRPVSAAVLFGLGRLFGQTASELMSEDPDRLANDLAEALTDPMFPPQETASVDIRALSLSAPWLAHRFLELHAAHRQLREAALTPEQATATGALPFEEVRDFFLYTDNYFDALDRAAETLATTSLRDRFGDPQALADYVGERHNIRCRTLADDDSRVRVFDAGARVLSLSANLQPSQRAFQLACQIGWLEQTAAIDGLLASARLTSDDARAVARSALVNYFAGALMMPYAAFQKAAAAMRHDLVRMSRRFNASIEQVCHRLSTLQRPGLKGVPVYFVKLDRAGTILKRHNANRFQFARFGGGCPLWTVHEAFEAPDRILVQKAELPDGSTYLCLAIGVSKDNGRHDGPAQRFALGIGCALSDAHQFVYADSIDLSSSRGVARIGVSCRICPRVDCGHRSVPSVARRIDVDANERGLLPYRLL